MSEYRRVEMAPGEVWPSGVTLVEGAPDFFVHVLEAIDWSPSDAYPKAGESRACSACGSEVWRAPETGRVLQRPSVLGANGSGEWRACEPCWDAGARPEASP